MPVAVNPSTGEAVYLDDQGQWVPSKVAENPQTGERLAWDGKAWSGLGKTNPKGSMLERGASYVDNLGRQFAQGGALNLADEFSAKMTELTGIGPQYMEGGDNSYEALLKRERGQDKAFQEESPVASTAANIAGGLSTAVAAAPVMPAAAPTMLGRVGQGVATGAGFGGAYGFGGGEGGVENRLNDAAQGAALGGALGGIAPVAVEGVAKGVNALANQTVNRLPFRQENAAMRKVAEALQRDGLTPDEAVARAASMGDDAALMDVGPNARSLARAAYTKPGEARTQIGDFLTSRQEGMRGHDMALQGGQANRISGMVDDLVPEDFASTQEGITQARKAFGADYEAAKGSGASVDTSALLSSLDDSLKTAKGGIRSALSQAKSFLFNADGTPDTSIAGLHQAKMAIDDLLSNRADTSMGNVARRELQGVQNQLVEAIEKASPEYASGRAGTAAQWRLDEALNSGADFMLRSNNPQSVAAAVAKMSPEEQHAFRVGAAQAIKSRLGDLNVRQDATKKLMDIPALEQKVRAAFGDDELFRRYISSLEGEKEMFKSYGSIMGGSRTAEVAAEQADAAKNAGPFIDAMRDIGSGRVAQTMRGVANLGRAGFDYLSTPEPLAKQYAKILTGRDVSALNKSFEAGELSAAKRRELARLLGQVGAIEAGQAVTP